MERKDLADHGNSLEWNCHGYCPYGKQCRYREGKDGLDPDDCSMYYKIDDITNDARMEEKEEAFEAEDDWE